MKKIAAIIILLGTLAAPVVIFASNAEAYNCSQNCQWIFNQWHCNTSCF